ncbi:MAG: histidine--tRNA ligase [Candidatus Omnitrophota bacterium]|jgi:histidyl-tRNA synthetase
MFKRIPGTKDILPAETAIWQEIEKISRGIFALYNYQEIRPPLVEEACLFDRSLGASAEIVQKQMFMIKNNEDLYALRPEGTASVVRSYIENDLDKTSGFLKVYYMGPMFRFERPQKGRYRQFHHIGCEVLGSQEASLDVEVIALARELLDNFSVSGYKIRINSLGCSKDKETLSKNLKDALKDKADKLCEDCQKRLKINVLRILDCKNEPCRQIVDTLKLENKHLCPDCLEHFNTVLSGLDLLGIPYKIDHSLVRGLDYYNRTVFEITHQELGSQDAIGAGGRYNNLVKELGGPDIGAIGFAFGIERVLLVSKLTEAEKKEAKLVFLITLGKAARAKGISILSDIRKMGIPCDTDYEEKSLKGCMRKANDLNARMVLILGENELKNNTITLKDMVSGQQKQVALAELEKEVKC